MREEHQRFLAKYRLKGQKQFQIIFKKGTVEADSVLVIHAIQNSLDYSRIGISVSKRVGNAPTRNRWKRWIREGFRIQRVHLPRGIDFVIRPRKDAVGNAKAVADSIRKLMQRLAN